MILIAPDKFKGTLTAFEAADAIAEAFPDNLTRIAPMADGGEGTADVLCYDNSSWNKVYIDSASYFYLSSSTKTAVIDSSAVIGIMPDNDILARTSYRLGEIVKDLISNGMEKVIIGVGGTGTCDGGEGFIKALGTDCLERYRSKIEGLIDVRVPLLPDSPTDTSSPSALMFTKQKGATINDIPILFLRLKNVKRKYDRLLSTPYDGAGGGLGFALANAIGARCHIGAEYVLSKYSIDWTKVKLVITGEGKIDKQTSQGKVVDVVKRAAACHNVPCIAIGGCVDDDLIDRFTISACKYLPDLPLNKETAKDRLSLAAQYVANNIVKFTNH